MFGKSWRVGSIGGIPINVDSSWVWIAVLVTYSLWLQFHYLGVTTGAAFGFASLAAVLFFGSVLLHELAHAVTARLSGIKVFGITLVFFGGFTSAKSDEKGPGPAFLISAVGPGTSLVLGGLFWALSHAVRPTSALLSGAFGYVGWVNLFMAVFNVLPGLPLDGGRMLQSTIWRITGDPESGTRVAARAGMAVGGLLLGVGVGAAARGDTRLFIWLALIGVFIFQGARSTQQQIGLRERLARGTVADIMEPPPPAVPSAMSLSEALDRFLRGHEGEAFPVVEDGKVIGMVSFGSAREIGMKDPLRPVVDALIPLLDVVQASPNERLDAVAERLGAGRAALVLRDGELAGAIQPGAISRWARAQAVR